MHTIAGFLIQWPTIITAVMAPILIVMYARLAKKEEKAMLERFGEEYTEYMKQVPAFIPKKLIRFRDLPEILKVFRLKSIQGP